MIHTILDTCQYVIETQGGPQSPCWLASLMDEMKLWKANEQKIRAALDKDIAKMGNASRFVKVSDDEYGLRTPPTSQSIQR